MSYPRPSYLQPGIPTVKNKLMFSNIEVDIPVFDSPITPLENFKLATARKTPIWIPNSLTDFQSLMTQDVAVGSSEQLVGADFHRNAKEDYTFYDWFNTNWTWVCSAGGAMLTPGTCLCDDITDWERQVKFPNINDWEWQTKADAFMKNVYDPKKVLQMNIGQGATERLVSVLGGYTEGMIALAVEPEAVLDFINRFIDFMIELFDHLYRLYPINLVTYHDDWATEKDTFFSEKMMEELVYYPTKRLIDHIKSKGAAFELHCCGNCTRFLPYMIDMGVDFLQIQRRAVDIPAMKVKYGDKIGFDTGIEGLAPGAVVPEDQLIKMVDNTVDIYGKSGGSFISVFGGDAKTVWNIVTELNAYSREFYDRERGE